MDVVRQVGQRHLGFSPLDPDRADEQSYLVLLMCEDVLDAGAHAGFRRIGLCGALRHGLASRLLAMDPADLAVPAQPAFVRLATVGGIGPDIGGRIVVGHDVPEHAPVKAGPIGNLTLADEPEPTADRDAAFVAKAEDRNIRLRFAVRRRPGGTRMVAQSGTNDIQKSNSDSIVPAINPEKTCSKSAELWVPSYFLKRRSYPCVQICLSGEPSCWRTPIG